MFGVPLDLEGHRLPAGFEIVFDRARMSQAVAVVFHIPDLGDISRIQKPKGQIWVAWSMECDTHYPCLLDPDFMSLFDLKMSYHRDADIPVPYCQSSYVESLRSKPRRKLHSPLLASFISSRFDRSGRFKYQEALMRHTAVDSYGKILNTKRAPSDKGRQTKLETIAKYKFTLAFENAIGPDYVTEKFFDPLIAGSVPVYLGAPNIDLFAPGDRCYIDVRDFESPKSLAQYLTNLSEDQCAYQDYFSWKSQPFRPSFQRLVDMQREHPFVRLCNKIKLMHGNKPPKSPLVACSSVNT
jgi:hypothetical protein